MKDVLLVAFKLNQLTDYRWLTKDKFDKSANNMDKLRLSNHAQFEHRVVTEAMGRMIIGFVDCIDGDDVYEFKCVSELKEEHVLQLVSYKHLIDTNDNNSTNTLNYYLYNILTDELLLVDCNRSHGKMVFEVLLNRKT